MKTPLRVLRAVLPVAMAAAPLAVRATTVLTNMNVDPVSKVATMSWSTDTIGNTYFVQVSGDLQNWQYIDYIKTGDGGSHTVPFDSTVSPRLFCRLRYIDITVPTGTDPGDADFTGDGLTNYQKLALHIDPLAPT